MALLAACLASCACRSERTPGAATSAAASETQARDDGGSEDTPVGAEPTVSAPETNPAGRLADAEPAAAGLDGETLAHIDDAVSAALARGELPGAVVLVARRGRVAFRRAYGLLLDDHATTGRRVPMRSDAIFDLASLTKPLATALALFALRDDGLLSLGDAVGAHLPELRGTAAGRPSLEALLLHTSGYPVAVGASDLAKGLAVGLARVAERARAHPEAWSEAGTFRYSDLGYIVLGAVVERVSGRSLDAFARERLYDRLGLHDTGFRPRIEGASAAKGGEVRLVPTARVDGGWRRGEVHDPLARALAGVAGHAGLFSTADEVAVLGEAVLDGGAVDGDDERGRILSPEGAREMTRARPVAGGSRSPGWDVDSPHAGARGSIFGRDGFGHTGFTGTSLWVDAQSHTLVVLLSSRLHPDGHGDVRRLRREVATLVGQSLRPQPAAVTAAAVLTGIDVLERERFAPLRGKRVGLLGHRATTDHAGRTTLDVLQSAPELELVTLFAPEHGLDASADGAVAGGRDRTTGARIVSLYGTHRRPTADDLAGIDALVVDLQDAGARFFTYVSTMLYALEAAATAGIEVLVLDRPNPWGGLATGGPLLDEGRESFVGAHRLPVRHGMTLGELAGMFCAERSLACRLQVVRMEGWRRTLRFGATGLRWRAPSPNLRTAGEALLYPGIALLETTSLSVGRGTGRPFELVGAPWLDGEALVATLGEVPGVHLRPVHFVPRRDTRPGAAEPPQAGRRCGGVAIELVDASRLEPERLGLELALAIERLAPERFDLERIDVLLGHRASLDALSRGRPASEVVASWADDLVAFERRRAPFLLYPP